MSREGAAPRTTPVAIALLALAALCVTRLPLLGGGYGADDDAWRNIVGALHSRALGHYVPSRAPGFPLFEGLLILLAPLGPVATNAAAALAGIAAAFAFDRVLVRRAPAARGWAWVAFAFSTPVWVELTQTMDYAFGLAGYLAAYAALQRRRMLLAATLLALATTCRATYALVLPALILHALLRGETPRRVGAAALLFLALVAAAYAPALLADADRGLLAQIGSHARSAHLTAAALPWTVRASLTFLFGKWGAGAAALGLAWSAGAAALRRRRGPSPGGQGGAVPAADPSGPRADAAFELASAAAFLCFFALIPYEIAYLIPVLPLALLGLARVLPRPALAATAVAMVLGVLVSYQVDTRRFSAGALADQLERRHAQDSGALALLQPYPEAPTLRLVRRAAIQRLVLLAPDLVRGPAAWSPFNSDGVALFSRDGRLAFAEHLGAADSAAVTRAGWRIEARTEQP